LEEARTSFNLMLEIRNKTMEAYQEMMRMQA
jgi:flagellar hook-basal body complex protein FliE